MKKKHSKSLVATVLPYVPNDVLKTFENTSLEQIAKKDLRDVDNHAKQSKQHRERQINRKTHGMHPTVLYLGDTEAKRSLKTILKHLEDPNSELLIIGHGSPEMIGTYLLFGKTPEELAGDFAKLGAPETLQMLQCNIKLFVCNSGTSCDDEPSFAQRFFCALKDHGFTGVSVTGFIGYLGEVSGKNKNCYITEREHADLGSRATRLYRVEESMITFMADGSVILPKVKLSPVIPEKSHIRTSFEGMAASSSEVATPDIGVANAGQEGLPIRRSTSWTDLTSAQKETKNSHSHSL